MRLNPCGGGARFDIPARGSAWKRHGSGRGQSRATHATRRAAEVPRSRRGVAVRIRRQQPSFDKRVRGESSFAGSNPALSVSQRELGRPKVSRTWAQVLATTRLPDQDWPAAAVAAWGRVCEGCGSWAAQKLLRKWMAKRRGRVKRGSAMPTSATLPRRTFSTPVTAVPGARYQVLRPVRKGRSSRSLRLADAKGIPVRTPRSA